MCRGRALKGGGNRAAQLWITHIASAVKKGISSDWFDGYTVFSPTPPPFAILRPSTSTTGDT